MTVAELIARLRVLKPDLDIEVRNEAGDYDCLRAVGFTCDSRGLFMVQLSVNEEDAEAWRTNQ